MPRSKTKRKTGTRKRYSPGAVVDRLANHNLSEGSNRLHVRNSDGSGFVMENFKFNPLGLIEFELVDGARGTIPLKLALSGGFSLSRSSSGCFRAKGSGRSQSRDLTLEVGIEVFGLVQTGGWLPPILPSSADYIIHLIDQNVVGDLLLIGQSDADRPNTEYSQAFFQNYMYISTLLCVMEGNQRGPMNVHEIETYQDKICTSLEASLPRATIFRDGPGVPRVLSLLRDTGGVFQAEIELYNYMKPKLQGKLDSHNLAAEIDVAAKRLGLSGTTFMRIALLSAAYAKRNDQRWIRKFLKLDESTPDVGYNVASDLRSLYMLLLSAPVEDDATNVFLTKDKHLVRFWLSINPGERYIGRTGTACWHLALNETSLAWLSGQDAGFIQDL